MPTRLTQKRPTLQESLVVSRATKIALADAVDADAVDVAADPKPSLDSRIRRTIQTPKIATRMICSRLRAMMIHPPACPKMTTLPRRVPRELMRKAANILDLADDDDAAASARMNDRSKARRSEQTNDPRATKMRTRLRTTMRSAMSRRPTRSESKKNLSHQ